MSGNARGVVIGVLVASVTLVGVVAVAPARAVVGPVEDAVPLLDCNGELGDPEPGTPGWDAVFHNTALCRRERPLAVAANPAFRAAQAANIAAGSRVVDQPPAVDYDPFRDPWIRWGGTRGDFLELTWTNRDGEVREAFLYSPFEDDIDDPLPVVLLHSHVWRGHPSYPASAQDQGWQWVAQVLAEHGYVVMYADLTSAGNDTIDATDWLLSTPEEPHPDNPAEFNPWHARIDQTRLGLAGVIGGPGSATQTVAHEDERFDAVVSLDGPTVSAITTPRTPQLTLVRDLTIDEENLGEGPPTGKPALRGGDLIFDLLRDHGVDAMQVTLRSMTHGEQIGTMCTNAAVVAQYKGCTLYSEAVSTYYMLAWFDRYLGDAGVRDDATRRLTATDRFDGSADEYSIGTGVYDPQRALAGGSVEAGNVPITIEGMSIRNRLSFWYPSRYFLDGGALHCENVRDGCA